MEALLELSELAGWARTQALGINLAQLMSA